MGTSFSPEELAGAEACFAAAWGLLYEEPTAAAVAEQVADDLFASAPFAADEPVSKEGLALMAAWCAEARAEYRESGAEAPCDAVSLAASPLFGERVGALKREWLRLFAGVGTPEASCLESFYVEPNRHMFGKNTLAVREVYRTHGLQVEKLHSEPDDHLGLMLGFVSHLIGEELDALEAADSATAAQAAADQEAFLVEHMLPWLPAWRFLVEEHAVSDYYRGLGDFVFGLISCYAERFDIVYDAEGQRFKQVR
ncbi:molecular chaperone TorD family protein [uncultured Adlercreutzia sp.]|uniref:TorD/DmsD family molecular chaperone n=1 Tax=uncultured Adlercreutzia sp. TaxID=875803 RepID=UPI0025EB8F8D|nr:molecular chaperone TorD family protein [uncultured Adlercreutzia sp.]